jgi:anaerobic selenocysteine-containing dehydrogenase
MPDGTHRPIPVEQAIDEVADRVQSILERFGPRAVAGYAGTYSVANPATNAVYPAWLKAMGSRMGFTSNTIDQPGKAVAQALHGAWLAPPQGFLGADTALIIGANPLIAMSGGLPHTNPGLYLKQALERGFKLIVIDPRRSETAARAYLHLQPKPGEDISIVAGIIRVIAQENLYDRVFVDENVRGFQELCRAVAPFTPESVAARADVPAQALVDAARTFATAGRGVATAGTGPNMSGRGTLLEYLILALNTICGRWLRAGERVPNPGTLVPQFSAKAQATPPWSAYGYGEKLRVRGLSNAACGLPTAALADEILLEGEGQVKALFVTGGNPMAAWPDQLKTYEAMKKLELLVQIDIKMAATAKLADYVIAPKLPLEMPGMTINPELLSLYGVGFGYTEAYGHYTPAIVDPPAGSDLIEEWELFYGLAQRMGLQLRLRPLNLGAVVRGPSFPLDMENKPTTDEIFEMITRSSRIPLDEVKKHPHGALFPDPPVYVEPREPDWSSCLDIGNAEMMTDLMELSREAIREPEVFEFRLISRRMMNALNSSGRDLAGLTRSRLYNPAFMNPLDLDRLGLVPGDVVEICSDRASILGVVEADETIRERLISMAHAFGDAPEHDAMVRKIGSNTGRLTSIERDYDRYTGMPLMSNIPVSVRRYEGPLTG